MNWPPTLSKNQLLTGYGGEPYSESCLLPVRWRVVKAISPGRVFFREIIYLFPFMIWQMELGIDLQESLLRIGYRLESVTQDPESTGEREMPDDQNTPPRKIRAREAKIGTTEGSADRFIGQANSLLWAATHLQDILDETIQTPDHDSVDVAGCLLGGIVLKAFATELALKALYWRESGRAPEHKHDLYDLFNKLEPSTQGSLERRFHRIWTAKEGYDGQPLTMSQVLKDHKDDFVRWRYIYERKGFNRVELIRLEPAVEAVIDEYGL